MIARTGDWIGSVPVAGTKTNGQRTVSGNRITIAMSSANKKAPSNSQAVERIIQGGGSCGNISDSASSEPRSVSCELMENGFRSPVAGLKDNSTGRVVPSIRRAYQPRQRFLVRAPR